MIGLIKISFRVKQAVAEGYLCNKQSVDISLWTRGNLEKIFHRFFQWPIEYVQVIQISTRVKQAVTGDLCNKQTYGSYAQSISIVSECD